MARTVTASAAFEPPLGEMNTTPLIDVMLVLLVMFILAVPAAVNQVPVDLPAPGPVIDLPRVQPLSNTIGVSPAGQPAWNGQAVTPAQLAWLLQQSRRLKPEPELRFQPDSAAPYDAAARVLGAIKASGVTAFGFVDNDRFAAFSKARPPL